MKTIASKETEQSYGGQYPYILQNLIPLTVWYDEEGQSYEVYNLPAPKRWQFGADSVIDVHTVNKIRVSLFTEEGTAQAVVIPFNEEGREDFRGTIIFKDVHSVADVLEAMGFVAIPSPVQLLNFRPVSANS